jgi:hypothetical protein
MRHRRFLFAMVLPLAFALQATAGPLSQLSQLWSRNKPNPAERVPQLIVTVKTDQDEHHRADAAHELRDYDFAKFPEIVQVLADVARSDNSASVRAEAVQTLGKLRPISQDAGWAIEDATKDPSIRVRLQARTSLMSYRMSGYHSERPAEGATTTATAHGSPALVAPGKTVPLTPAPATTLRYNPGETAPPPLAQPLNAIPTSNPAGLPKAPTPVGGPDLLPNG